MCTVFYKLSCIKSFSIIIFDNIIEITVLVVLSVFCRQNPLLDLLYTVAVVYDLSYDSHVNDATIDRNYVTLQTILISELTVNLIILPY